MSAKAFACALLTASVLMTGCSNPPPFASYDPPPTFAFKLVAQDPRLQSKYSGSALRFNHLADRIHPSFLPSGSRNEYSVNATFSKWYTVENGRWPALWRVQALDGCGEGTGGDVHIDSKLRELICYPIRVPIGVSPSSYSTSSQPGGLSIHFGTGAGMPVALYVVEPNTSTLIIGPVDTWLDGGTNAWVSVPNLGPGQYYVLAESSSAPELGGVGSFTVYTPSPPPSGNDTLQSGHGLYENQHISSQDGSHTLFYQSDGNLVLYGPPGPIWASMVNSSPGRAEMQTDGNLVSYDGSGVPLWATNTYAAGSVLRVENQGRIVMYGPGGNPIWWAP